MRLIVTHPSGYIRRHVVPSTVSLAGVYAGSCRHVRVAGFQGPTNPAFSRYRQGSLVI